MPDYAQAPELTDDYIQNVWKTLPRYVRSTFILPSTALSDQLGCELTIASETFQYTGSFKFRAAYNLLSSIPHRQVIAASSGNFGQAVAFASKLLGKQCIVTMPKTSARVKVEAVPPAFDDYRVVAGNSTLGKEIFEVADFDVIVVPIGGGGLSAGLVIARDYLQSQAKIIGAEPLPGNDAARSFRSGQLLSNEQEPATIADGARTLSLGHLNWEILQKGLADVIEVADETIMEALRRYFLYVNLKVEPTGALALGALLAQPELFYGKRVCCVVSGGNVDPAVYARALLEN
ncbi:MAG: pyridoxal-phosphate dependent enzyme [Chloroflexi bacterium]|nr:MAG: pyridoxal-phosphate dependent enzyme [Chloroflexota bacterium]